MKNYKTPIHPDMEIVEDIEQVSSNDRLFFELGQYINGEWVRSGKFAEIEDPQEFISCNKRLKNKEYLRHHNFMVIKSK